jgi:hypothetical protein
MKPSSILFAFMSVAGTVLPTQSGAAGPSRDINTYVLFAYDELIFKGGSAATDSGHIRGGNIGVNFPGRASDGFSLKYATAGRAIMDAGTQAAADSVRADNPEGVFYDLYANSVSPSFAATILGSGPLPFATPIIQSADLPVLPFTPNRALTNNANDITIGGVGIPSPYTFSPGAYRDVRVNDDSTVTFGKGVFDMRSLSLGANVTVNVTDSTELRIDRGFSTNDGLRFGLGTQSGAHVFVGAYGFNPNSTQVTNFAHHGEIHVQFFAPTGWLDLGGDNDLFGRFWAQRISGDRDDDVNFGGPPLLKHFDCFEIHRPALNRTDVSLVDDFGSSTVTVKRGKRFCAPASKNGEDASAVDDPAHLTFYTLKQTTPRFAKVRGVTIANEFGTFHVDVLKPAALLVPTAKSLVSTPQPLGEPIDHFKCYWLTGTQFKTGPLAVEDQFGTTQLTIKKPLFLCLPVDKNGEGIIDPSSSLTCYQVTGAPPVSRPPQVFTLNQFGPDSFDFFGPRAFCAPSTATLP